MRWFTHSAARLATDNVAGASQHGPRSSMIAEALAVAACTLNFSRPIAPQRHQVAPHEPFTRSDRHNACERN